MWIWGSEWILGARQTHRCALRGDEAGDSPAWSVRGPVSALRSGPIPSARRPSLASAPVPAPGRGSAGADHRAQGAAARALPPRRPVSVCVSPSRQTGASCPPRDTGPCLGTSVVHKTGGAPGIEGIRAGLLSTPRSPDCPAESELAPVSAVARGGGTLL